MTTYAAIADSEIDAESPITDLLLSRLRDNPIAMAEGKAGAPRFRGLAAMTPAQYADLFPIVSTAGATTIPTYTYSGSLSNLTTASTTFVLACEITFNSRVSGTCRFSGTADYQGGVNPSYAEARLLKNGVQIAIATTSTSSSSGNDVTFTVDTNITNGDVFRWEVRSLGGVNGGRLINPSVSGSFDAIVTVGLPIKQSEILP
jgi:hypothetical protein